MDYVCIDRLQEDVLAAQTLAVYYDGQFENNVSYTLKDTPCGDVVGKTICCFPQGVRHRFPKDVVLQEMVAESYVGTTLWSSQGQPIGLIALIGRQPLADPGLVTSLLQLVAVRAAGELERRQAEEALAAAKLNAERAKEVAEQANRSKDHFLAVLSHELRNPLNPVLATASMLQQDPRFDADTREQLEVISRNAELEARLIDDLLDVTRIERGKVDLDRRPIELCTIIRRAMEVCLPDIQARKLEWGMDLGPAPALGSRRRRPSANRSSGILLKNAVKFTPVGGCVGIRCRRDGDGFVVAEVNDNGEGIEPADLGRIFNAFEQARTLHHPPVRGFGPGPDHQQRDRRNARGQHPGPQPGQGQGSDVSRFACPCCQSQPQSRLSRRPPRRRHRSPRPDRCESCWWRIMETPPASCAGCSRATATRSNSPPTWPPHWRWPRSIRLICCSAIWACPTAVGST